MGVYENIRKNTYSKPQGVYARIHANDKEETIAKVQPKISADNIRKVDIRDFAIENAGGPTSAQIRQQAALLAQQKELEKQQEQERWNTLSLGEKIADPFKTAGANIKFGDLGIEENIAWNEYRSKQDEESLKKAQEATRAREEYQLNNDRIGKGNALTKDFAQYLPQLGGQLKAGLGGAAAGAGAGALSGAGIALAAGQLGPQVAVPEEIATVPAGALTGAAWGGKGGYVTGTAKYGYDMMAGSAYKTLLDMGVPNDVALELSGDEALISSLIEGGGAVVDLITLGIGKLGSKGATTAAKEVAKNRLIAAAKAYGVNLVSEPLEEMAQEKVSIETEKKAAEKAGIERKATESDDWNRIKEAGEGALKVAAVSGGLNAGGNYVYNKTLQNLTSNPDTMKLSPLDESTRNQLANIDKNIEYQKQNEALANKQIQESVQNAKNNIENSKTTLALPEGNRFYADEKGNVVTAQNYVAPRTQIQNTNSPVNTKQTIIDVQNDSQNDLLRRINTTLPTQAEMAQKANTEQINTNPNLATQKAQKTYQSAKIAGMTDVDMQKAIDLNNMLRSGANLEFYDEKNIPQNVQADKAKIANGFYRDGTLWINKNSKNKVEQILGHELTHHLETTNSYNDLANTILDSELFYDFLAEKGYTNVAEFQTKLKEMGYNDAQMNNEMVARFVEEKMFTDQASIDRLARQNTKLVEKIKNWISDLVVSFKGTSQEKELRRIEGMYRKALEQARSTENVTGETQYHISDNLSNDIDNVLTNINERNPVKLRDYTPTALVQNGVKDLPMYENPSHIRKNVLTENEARNLGLQVNKNDHYHGLGKDIYIKAIDSLDDPRVVLKYKNRPNEYIILTVVKDNNNNNIIVPIEVTTDTYVNNVKIDINRIKSVYGYDRAEPDLNKYIKDNIKNNNLEKIYEKKKSSAGKTTQSTSNNSINLNDSSVNTQYAQESKNDTAGKEPAFSMPEIKEKQLKIILETNPMNDDYHVGIRNIDDIKTFDEVIDDDESFVWGDFSREDAQKALKKGEIKVYSSKEIKNGNFVSTSYNQARDYAGNGKVHSKIVPLEDVAWISGDEGQYAKVEETDKVSFSMPETDNQGRTLSKEQQEFFKDSKVRDEDGRLKAVYHGTAEEFTIFDEMFAKEGDYGVGFYFSDVKGVAEESAEGKMIDKDIARYASGDKGQVMETYLDMKKPSVWYNYRDIYKYNKMAKEVGLSLYDYMRKNYDGIIVTNPRYENEGFSESKYYVVFNPNQIKNVDNTNPTENPDIRYSVNPVEVGKKATSTKALSRYAQTLQNKHEDIPEQINLIQKEVDNGNFTHEVIHDKRSLNYAQKYIEDNGFDDAVKHWDELIKRGKPVDKDELALGQMIYNVAVDNKDTRLVMKMASDLVQEYTEIGRNLQSATLLRKMTPDGRLYALERSVQKINQDLMQKFDNFENIQIPEELADKLLRSETQKDMDTAVEQIQEYIASKIPATWQEKLNSWRYLAMLGNPRTHIRNIVGNAVFIPAVEMKNKLAQVGEKFIPQEQRTKATLTKKDAKLLNYAENDFDKNQETIRGENKYDIKSGIQEKRTIYSNGAIEAARKGNFKLLEAEDTLFLKFRYKKAFAGALKARGITIEQLRENSPETVRKVNEIRSYAINEAQKATYRDASIVASMVSRGKRKLLNAANQSTGASKLGYNLAYLGAEGVIPFAKTPINIVKRGIEYSPAGLLNGIKNAVFDVKSGKVTAAQAIDKIAAGTTGTAIAALGLWLASMGLVSGGEEEKDKEQALKQLKGNQDYALNIGNKSYTIDWTAPSSIPLFIGVELYNSITSEDESAYLNALGNLTEPVVEMSMLQGLNDTLTTLGQDSAIGNIVGKTLMNYLGQYNPTLFGQIARSVDPVRRTTYVDKNIPAPAAAQRFIQQQAAKIPGVSRMLPTYKDQFGQEQITDGVINRIVQNFFSPGYLKDIKEGTVEQGLTELYEKTGETSVIPSYASKSLTHNGEKINLTAKQYDTYAKTRGDISKKGLEGLFKDNYYKSLSDEQKVKVVEAIYDYAGKIAKTKVIDDYELEFNDKKIQKLQNEGLDFYKYILLKKTADADGNDYTSNDELDKAIKKYGLSRWQKTIKEKNTKSTKATNTLPTLKQQRAKLPTMK